MLATTVEDLLLIVRNELADKLADNDAPGEDQDKLWKTAELLTHATEAADAVARATLGLHEVISLPVVASVRVITLPQRVLHVREARLVTARRQLTPRNANEQHACDLFNNTGTPYEYVADYSPHAIELYPTPIAADTLELQCSVTVQHPFALSDQLPFLETPDQRLMITYMKGLAYQKHDAETQDLDRSSEYMTQFAVAAPLRRSTLSNYRRRPGTVRMNW